MEAALATNSLDLDALVASARTDSRPVPADLAPFFAALPLEPALPPIAQLRGGGDEAATLAGRVALPDVSGLPARIAVRHLHRLGLRVSQVGTGGELTTVPAPGALVLPGDTVTMRWLGSGP